MGKCFEFKKTPLENPDSLKYSEFLLHLGWGEGRQRECTSVPSGSFLSITIAFLRSNKASQRQRRTNRRKGESRRNPPAKKPTEVPRGVPQGVQPLGLTLAFSVHREKPKSLPRYCRQLNNQQDPFAPAGYLGGFPNCLIFPGCRVPLFSAAASLSCSWFPFVAVSAIFSHTAPSYPGPQHPSLVLEKYHPHEVAV